MGMWGFRVVLPTGGAGLMGGSEDLIVTGVSLVL